MNARYHDSSVSVQANLRKQIKSRRDGRNQNKIKKVARGSPV